MDRIVIWIDRIGIWMNGKYLIGVAATIVLALPTMISEGMGHYMFPLLLILFILAIAIIKLAIK
jgi:hypothetical protein